MTEHVMKNDLALLRKGKLQPGDVLAVVRHLESCPACAAMAEESVDSTAAAEAWSSTLQSALRDHLRGDELFDYVDGRFSSAAMVEAGAHLQHCAGCRDDVADLRRLSDGSRQRWQRAVLSVAAVLVVAAGLGILINRGPTKPPAEPTRHPPVSVSPVLPPADVPPAAWKSLVDAAVGSGRIAPPDILAKLRMPGDTLRGEGRPRSEVVPDGVVVDAPRPTFRWTGAPGAVYTVSLFDSDRETARSAPLNDTSWTPERDLERGRTYRWQVAAGRGKETWIIPAAPQPAPVFRLLEDAEHHDLDSARRLYPGDHLLLGVLAAHYGLRQEAIEELTLARAAHPDSRSAALLESVRAWGSADRR